MSFVDHETKERIQDVKTSNFDTMCKALDELGEVQSAAMEVLKSDQDTNTEKFEKISEAMSKVMQQVQDLGKEKQKIEKAVESVEKRIARGVAEGVSSSKNSKITPNHLACIQTLYEGMFKSSKQKELQLIADHSEHVKKFLDEDLKNKRLSATSYKKTLQETINPLGGYYVHEDWLNDIVITRTYPTTNIRNYATIRNTTSNRVELYRADQEAAASVWLSEKEELGIANTPLTGKVEILIHKLGTAHAYTQEILDDASPIDAVSWLIQEAQERQMRDSNTAFIKGDGVNKPLGILSYEQWQTQDEYESGKLEHISTDNLTTPGQYTYDFLVDINTKLKSAYRQNAIWMINRLNWGDILKIKNDIGDPIIQRSDLLKTGIPDTNMTILGYPVIFGEDVNKAVSGTASTGNIIFGDLGGYLIMDRKGMRIQMDPFTKMSSDITLFYVRQRMGGALRNYESLKIGDCNSLALPSIVTSRRKETTRILAEKVASLENDIELLKSARKNKKA